MSTTEFKATGGISCVSLGMVILDEIRMPNKPPLLDVIGGSATFVTLGLRLFATESMKPGCLIMVGSDFPEDIREEMGNWRTSLIAIDSPDFKSSRGLLEYKDDTFGPKTFEYTTAPIRSTPQNLVGTPLLGARAFHFFGHPEEIIAQVPSLLQFREREHPDLPKPFLVWEPLPSSCAPANLASFRAACKLVDVFSPNHLELAALLHGDLNSDTRTSPPSESNILRHLETQGRALVDAGIAPDNSGTLVIRAGAAGALALQRDKPAIRVPAYYKHGSDNVVDPTGAGNAFLGGYVAGWLREEDVREALCYGAVAASFAIEQIGIPRGDVEGKGEERLGVLRGRLRMETSV